MSQKSKLLDRVLGVSRGGGTERRREWGGVANGQRVLG